MYEICKFCGASSTTSDKCSNCGAPIEKSDDGPVPYENSKIRDAIEKHYEEVGRRGYIIKSGRNETLTTTIYIDDKRAFEVRSSNGNIGRYSVFANHQDLTIALTNLSKRKSVLLPGKTKCFGDDKNELVATISELLAEIDPNLSDNRIRIDSYATHDSSIVRRSLILITIATYIYGVSDNSVKAPFIIAIFGTCSYMLFAPLQTNKNDHHYTLELFTKIVSVLILGIVVFVLMINSAYYFAGINDDSWFGWRNAAICLLIYFLVMGIYSYIQTFIIQCKKGYKYYGILLIPMSNIMVLFIDAFASADDSMSIFKFLCLMVSMLIQTILISVVNERRERLG